MDGDRLLGACKEVSWYGLRNEVEYDVVFREVECCYVVDGCSKSQVNNLL